MQLIQVSALAGLAACGGGDEPASTGSDPANPNTGETGGTGGSPDAGGSSTAFANGIPTELVATPTQCRAVRVSKVTDEVVIDTDVFDSEYSVSDGQLSVAALRDGPGTNYCSVPSRQYVESMFDADQLTIRDDGSILYSSPPAFTIWSATVAEDGSTHYEWNLTSVRGLRDLQLLVVGSSGEFKSCRRYITGLTHTDVTHCGEGLDKVEDDARRDQ